MLSKLKNAMTNGSGRYRSEPIGSGPCRSFFSEKAMDCSPCGARHRAILNFEAVAVISPEA